MQTRLLGRSISDECTTFRRSPRFLHQNNSPQAENASIVKLRVRKKVAAGSAHLLISNQDISSEKTKVQGTKKIPKILGNCANGLVKLASVPRRSPRLNSGIDESQNTIKMLRNSNLQTGVEDVENNSGCVPQIRSRYAGSEVKGGFENVKADDKVLDKCEKIAFGIARGTTCCVPAIPAFEEEGGNKNKGLKKRIQGEVINTKNEGRNATCCVLALPIAQHYRGDENKVQRKTTQGEVLNSSNNGWTEEEEAALQRAYLAAKPTPHFWKKVAKLIPGKSAQECFDKIHSDHLGPTQPKTRAKGSKRAASPIEQTPLSASKVLKSTTNMMRKPNHSKPKGHLVQKTARQLLQKHSVVDENYQADMFSVLEPTIDPSGKVFQSDIITSIPENSEKKQGRLQNLREWSSSGHEKPLLRFHGSSVLKEIKNRSLHEKYLDRLHDREAKRKSSQEGKASIAEGNEAQFGHGRDTIKAAKNALASNLNDAINQLRHVRDNSSSSSSDFDKDYIDGGNEDTDEDIC